MYSGSIRDPPVSGRFFGAKFSIISAGRKKQKFEIYAPPQQFYNKSKMFWILFLSHYQEVFLFSLSCTFTPLSPFCSLSLSPFRFGTSLITRFSDCVVVVVESFESSTSYAIWPVCVISTTDEEQRVTQPNSSIFNDYQELLVVEGQTCVCVCVQKQKIVLKKPLNKPFLLNQNIC